MHVFMHIRILSNNFKLLLNKRSHSELCVPVVAVARIDFNTSYMLYTVHTYENRFAHIWS